MPPKRPLFTDNLSPPPTQQITAGHDHHLSPAAGHQPDMPADAAVASASPQSKKTRENHNPNVAQSPDGATIGAVAPPITPNGQPPPAGPELSPSDQSGDSFDSSAPDQIVAGQGGAREAFLASQQQRVITCNLTLIPPSNVAITSYIYINKCSYVVQRINRKYACLVSS